MPAPSFGIGATSHLPFELRAALVPDQRQVPRPREEHRVGAADEALRHVEALRDALRVRPSSKNDFSYVSASTLPSCRA